MIEFDRSLLVLGGARSGKSRHAQAAAEAVAPEAGAGKEAGARLVFIATAQAFDEEMTERIARHRADRGAAWVTCEAPIDLVGAIRREDRAGTVILVDCLTLWTSNLLLQQMDVAAATDALVAQLARIDARVILVSNEVGYGIVPDNRLARLFRDAAGTLNQRVAAAVSQVDLVIAGLPMRVK